MYVCTAANIASLIQYAQHIQGESLTDGVASVELVGHIGVVLPGHPLPDGGLHQSAQRGKHVDWWVHLGDR